MAPNSTTQPSAASTAQSSGLGGAAIFGIVAGTLAIIIMSFSAFAMLRRRRVRQSQPRHSVISTEEFLGKAKAAGTRSYPGSHSRIPSDLVGMTPLLDNNQSSRPPTQYKETREQERPHSLYGAGVSPVSAFVNTYDEQNLGIHQTHADPFSNTTPFLSSSQATLSAATTSPPIQFEVPPPSMRILQHPEPSFRMPSPPLPPAPVPVTKEAEKQRSINIPPISIPQYPSVADDPVSDTHSAFSDDTASLYSQKSASTYAAHKSAGLRSSTFFIPPVPPFPPLPPLPPLPTHLQSLRIELRDVGLPDPETAESNKLLDRSETRVIGNLIKSRAARIKDAPARTFSNASHIERAGSIKPAIAEDSPNEESYNSRLAKIRQARLMQDVHVHVPMELLANGQTSDSATVANWSELARGVPQQLQGQSPLMSLTSAFAESMMSPPTPPSEYPYLGGSAPFFAHTAPLKISKGTLEA